ncbi:MAG TPA: APC family permease [Gammaproteobacteria bacterium]|nr:APC family permease [Gammaproteobacteria bacterium]
MSLFDKLIGKPLATKEQAKESLTLFSGVPALGLDTLSSTAYGPEAALAILLPLGLAGLHYFSLIMVGVIIVLFTLYLSYQQTIAAYPTGGSAYTVASANLGKRAGVWAAIALLLDYWLNVAVGISAGVGAVVSAFPELGAYRLILCLAVLLILTLLNLRGVRQSGLVLAIPTFAFIVFMSVTFIIGLVKTWHSAGLPNPIVAPPPPPAVTANLSIWLLLGAFANGLTAMTGIEAVSNAVPLFKKPSVKNAQHTMTIIIGTLAVFLLLLAYLAPAYHIVAMDETKPGYQTILSQINAAVVGKNILYYLSMASIFIVLTYSAQTSFISFPRVCRLLAEDSYLPHFFADQGRRLVYSVGIGVLALLSGALLVIFNGIMLKLIPLFAIGAFTAFLFSQVGMALHWLSHKDATNAQLKLLINSIGALITAIALVIIIVAKFKEGGWIILVAASLLALLFSIIHQRYSIVARQVDKSLLLQTDKMTKPIAIVPIAAWDRVAEKAIRFALMIADEVNAVYICTDKEEGEKLKKIWSHKVKIPAKAAGLKAPNLEIIYSPYRRIYQPIIRYIKKMCRSNKDQVIAVIIPQLIEPHWYARLLHNVRDLGLRLFIYLQRDKRIVLISAPWYLS